MKSARCNDAAGKLRVRLLGGAPQDLLYTDLPDESGRRRGRC